MKLSDVATSLGIGATKQELDLAEGLLIFMSSKGRDISSASWVRALLIARELLHECSALSPGWRYSIKPEDQ